VKQELVQQVIVFLNGFCIHFIVYLMYSSFIIYSLIHVSHVSGTLKFLWFILFIEIISKQVYLFILIDLFGICLYMFKVGLGISRTNADSHWNPVYNAFHRFFVVETKRFVGSTVHVILAWQTCGQRSSKAA